MISFVPPNKKLKGIDLVKRMRLANVVNKIFLLGTLQHTNDADYKSKGCDVPYKPLFLTLKWSGIV
jgi:tRNA splicing endonuclease